jgi:hypothetical protein
VRDLEPYLYGEHSSGLLPEYYVDGQLCEANSDDEVRRALSDAEVGAHWWLTCQLPSIRHPRWWPRDNPVPLYDMLIVGAGASGIGMHRDVITDEPVHGSRFVSTYLMIGAGRKHVVLLPPTGEGARLAKVRACLHHTQCGLEPSCAYAGAGRAGRRRAAVANRARLPDAPVARYARRRALRRRLLVRRRRCRRWPRAPALHPVWLVALARGGGGVQVARGVGRLVIPAGS